MHKWIAPVCLAASALLAGCGGESPSALAPPPSPVTTPARPDFPGTSASGVSAHYVVLVQPERNFQSVITVQPAQMAESYRHEFPGAKPLGGAIIVYPDRSTQTADGSGAFDAGMSSYAQAHPQKFEGKDVTVIIKPPSGSSLRPLTTQIFAPSESEETGIESGVIPPGAKPSSPPVPGIVPADANPAGFTWSCDTADYEQKGAHVFQGWSWQIHFKTADTGHWYEPHFSTCGTDQPSSKIEWSRIEWQKSSDSPDVKWIIHYGLGSQTAGGAGIAAWASPNNYDGAVNRHLLLLRVVRPPCPPLC